MMMLPFPIKKVVVLLTHGTDKISIDLDGPTPFPEMQYALHANIDARAGYGVQWVRDNLGITPEVIDTR